MGFFDGVIAGLVELLISYVVGLIAAALGIPA